MTDDSVSVTNQVWDGVALLSPRAAMEPGVCQCSCEVYGHKDTCHRRYDVGYPLEVLRRADGDEVLICWSCAARIKVAISERDGIPAVDLRP